MTPGRTLLDQIVRGLDRVTATCETCKGSGIEFISAGHGNINEEPCSMCQPQTVCQTCNGTGKEGRHSICRDCDEIIAQSASQDAFAFHVKVPGWGEELLFTEDGAKQLLTRIRRTKGVDTEGATISPLYLRATAAEARIRDLEERLAKAAEALEQIADLTARCEHDGGFDREIGPIGCNLGDKCLCIGLHPIARTALSQIRSEK